MAEPVLERVAGAPQTARRVCFADVEAGDSIPSLVVPPVSRLQLALFAGAAADPNPIHVDDEAARAGGLPGVIVHGMLTMALLGRALTQWVPQRQLRTFSARFVAMAFPGDTITASGRITAKSVCDGENRVDVELFATNQRGERLLQGAATVALP
ncbi:MAG TPA: MaoC/PaaZ C-terminal domain-containing protein [Casimicrobiaceae bacterium]|jgi:acyl dehydratase|nr:MaoC/PaaZ C-terminal domain-containing protein [Casimicrobiaceae bacterium]